MKPKMPPKGKPAPFPFQKGKVPTKPTKPSKLGGY